MSPERIIPITPIMRRYQRLRTAAQRDRLSEARRVLEHPEELAAEFATSVRHFAAYRNVNEHFYDAAAAKRAPSIDRGRCSSGPTTSCCDWNSSSLATASIRSMATVGFRLSWAMTFARPAVT